MKNDNEKVCDIVREMKSLAESIGSKRRVNIPTLTVQHWIGLADRIEAAHKREVADLKTAYDRAVSADAHHAGENEKLKGEISELRECLKEAIDVSCARCNVERGMNCDGKNIPFKSCLSSKWRKALEVHDLQSSDKGDGDSGTADDDLADFIENAAIRDCKQFRFALKNAAKRLRQNAELRECLKQAVFSECRHLEDQKCETCPARTRGKAFCSAERWRKALEGGAK